MQTAARLFAAGPYHGVLMDEVARAAGVAKPTLYRYFATKEALFIEALATSLAELRDGIADARHAPGSAAERLGSVVRLILERVGRLSPAIRAVESQSSELGEQSRRVLREGFRGLCDEVAALFAQGAATGEFTVLDDELAALLVIGGIRMTAHAGATETPGSDVAPALTNLLLHGIGAREPRPDAPTGVRA